jgi:DNA (cytosine-5)-methyltransferase 1
VRYLSVCSGIEAATVAWHDLGWTPVAFSEIEPFPSAVLKHHYPHVPNVGDMTKFKEWNLGPIDLLVGGTPCQSFSVAGLRKGLDDPRGNLMLTFLAIAERHRPRWIVWENVPGVLSSNGGRDFGTFLGALGQLGYGWAFRVLDAQWFGVAQRRRRVFVVGCLGDQAGAAAVLFESESVQRNPAPSREKGQGAARGVARCFAGSSESRVAATLETTSHDYSRADGFSMVAQPVAFHPTQDPISSVDVCHALSGGSKQGTASAAVAQPVAYGIDGEQNASEELIGTLRSHQSGGYEGARVAQPVATFAKTHKPMSATDAEGWSPVDAAPTVTHWPRDRSDAGTDVAVVQPVGTDCYNGAITGEVAATMGTTGSGVNGCGPTVMQPVGSFKPGQSAAARSIGYEAEVAPALEGGGGGNNKPAVHVAMQVRRLTPTECERLQGFPDGYTNISWRKKDEAPDGPRYKALGNSMAVPCMKWIGERIAKVTK